MQDDTTPPVPLKDVPLQGQAPAPAPPVAPQPAAPAPAPPEQPAAALAEPPKETSPVTEAPVPVKEQGASPPKRSSSPVAPVIVAVLVFVVLAVCAYFVFKGM